MNQIHAPAQLPFAPRPIASELLSSWLLRVAAANLISLRELLDSVESRYGPVLSNVPVDYGVPDAAVMALSKFCRVRPKTVRMLDLRHRVSGLTTAMLLAFKHSGVGCPRCSSHRIGYAFCPSCVANQPVIHVPWEWSLSCLSRCTIHQRFLLDGCPLCGHSDPLTFTEPHSPDSRLCRSCGGEIAGGKSDGSVEINVQDEEMQAVENDYRAALDGAAPRLLPKATARAFRLFVEDMLQLLTGSLNRGSVYQGVAEPFSRQDVLAMITGLILNAAPNPNQTLRHRRRARGLRLWRIVLSAIPEHEGGRIERTSIRWPVALRRHFLSGLYYSRRKCWPYTPYREAAYSGRRLERAQVDAAFGLASRSVKAPNSVRVLSAVESLWSGI